MSELISYSNNIDPGYPSPLPFMQLNSWPTTFYINKPVPG